MYEVKILQFNKLHICHWVSFIKFYQIHTNLHWKYLKQIIFWHNFMNSSESHVWCVGVPTIWIKLNQLNFQNLEQIFILTTSSSNNENITRDWRIINLTASDWLMSKLKGFRWDNTKLSCILIGWSWLSDQNGKWQKLS